MIKIKEIPCYESISIEIVNNIKGIIIEICPSTLNHYKDSSSAYTKYFFISLFMLICLKKFNLYIIIR